MADRIVIDDDTPIDAGDVSAGPRGLVPRPADQVVMAAPFDPKKLPLIPRSEWPDRIADMTRNKSRLSDVVLGAGIPSKDQNDPKYMRTRSPRWGYCWFYAPVTGLEALNAVMGKPHVALSAFAGAYTLKKGADEGAWGALATDWLMTKGVPPESVWPNFRADMGLNSAETWAAAAANRIDAAVVDVAAPVYNRDLTLDQKMTLLLNRCPVVNDYMWWGHCVVSLDPVDADPSRRVEDNLRWGSRDRNTWGDEYGDRGLFVVKGQRCVPDNAVGLVTALAG
ncbi:Putative uncharacterized protein OS=Daphnia pulex GN=DAPPUDRAFT_120886 PE=4 SV=1 [Gemmataceae bacterium]|nr:Putative uncharacterized protein OS=Daphnia pulex GN=DAPPUDRAFT_120886 PE=4 SV=1 [Gemmataceae bacterium]VTT96588.1 Putative uncharacterized protein OS=Daphnia pulex GN=DAPPUDRAFT_120886 PE=4 SV=1 [Gemmataceae bacterium]